MFTNGAGSLIRVVLSLLSLCSLPAHALVASYSLGPKAAVTITGPIDREMAEKVAAIQFSPDVKDVFIDLDSLGG